MNLSRLVLGWVLLIATLARADGAFPDSLGILLPEDQPNTFYASTNFGLVVSTNQGADWYWVCEEVTGLNAWQYTLGAPPAGILYAVSQDGIRHSADGACTWKDSVSPFTYGSAFDVFPSPTQPHRALALGQLPGGDGGVNLFAAYESQSAGVSFDQPLRVMAPTERPSGIESSRSDPNRLVMTMGSTDPDSGFSLLQVVRWCWWNSCDRWDSMPSWAAQTGSLSLCPLAMRSPSSLSKMRKDGKGW